MPNETKFTQRNSAAGTMTGSQLARKAGSGQMSAKEIADQVMRANKNRNAAPAKPTKTSTATKTSGSNVKPTTNKPIATKGMKTQNIPEVTVSVTKKTGTNTKPVTPPVKEKGAIDQNVYIIRDPQNEYAYREVKRGTKGAQPLKPSKYETMKSAIGPMKNK